jgi:hypothetical protein
MKIELGYNALNLSILTYAIDGVTQMFEQIVAVYLQAGELNFSATPVTQASVPTLVTLTLTNSPTAILQGDRLVIDQDANQEFAHAQVVSVSGPTTVAVLLQNPHVGTFPVTVEGGEALARYYLRNCVQIADRIARAASRAGVQQVNDVKLFASTPTQKSTFDELVEEQMYWRNELATAIGVRNLRSDARGAGSMVEMY